MQMQIQKKKIFFSLSRDCSQTLLESKTYVVGRKELSVFIFGDGGGYIKPCEDTGLLVWKMNCLVIYKNRFWKLFSIKIKVLKYITQNYLISYK